MKRVLLVTGIFVASASVAAAHNTQYAWKAAKAEVMVTSAATIPIPQPQKGELEAELRTQMARFQALALTAQQERGDWLAAGTYNNYALRYRTALVTARAGLAIEVAKCTGTGRALSGKRYKHFRCSATSRDLEIPSAEILPAEPGKNPEVVEGPARMVGPLQAVFALHVTGKTKIAYRIIA